MSDSPAVQHHPGVLNVYLRLMKLRVVLLLQVTAISSLVVHDLLIRSGVMSGLQPSFTDTILSSLVVIVGGTLAAGGSNALNMVWERDIDPLMERTRHRPLPGWRPGGSQMCEEQNPGPLPPARRNGAAPNQWHRLHQFQVVPTNQEMSGIQGPD